MKPAILCAAALGFASLAVASTVPAGWKVVKDHKGTCQYAVPPDWKTGTFGDATSPDGKGSINVNGAQQTMSEIKQNSAMVMPVDKVVEDTPSRYWYVYKAQGSAEVDNTNWYVAVPASSSVTCIAQISFKGATTEALGKQIVNTIGPVK
jgi:hypothetical protein